MTASCAPEDFDGRRAVYRNRLFQFVPDAVLSGGLHGVVDFIALDGHGPLLPQKKVGTPQDSHPRHTEILYKRLPERNSRLAENPGEISELHYDARPAHIKRFQVLGRL